MSQNSLKQIKVFDIILYLKSNTNIFLCETSEVGRREGSLILSKLKLSSFLLRWKSQTKSNSSWWQFIYLFYQANITYTLTYVLKVSWTSDLLIGGECLTIKSRSVDKLMVIWKYSKLNSQYSVISIVYISTIISKIIFMLRMWSNKINSKNKLIIVIKNYF